jgi:sugar/nucleoside kinase (ribokinase family)
MVMLAGPLAIADHTIGAFSRATGGTAAIVAHNAASAGFGPIIFTGHVGADLPGDAGLERLRRRGVAIGALVRSPASSEVLVLVGPDGERTMVASDQAPDWAALRPGFRRSDIVFFEGWHLFDPCGYEDLVRFAKSSGAVLAVDVCSASRAKSPARHLAGLAALAPDIVLANEAEARVLGLEPNERFPILVVHAGAAPTRLWRGGELASVRVFPVEPVDTTGAGDSFAAGFLGGLIRGVDLRRAVDAGHRLAQAVVLQEGPMLATCSPLPIDTSPSRHARPAEARLAPLGEPTL